MSFINVFVHNQSDFWPLNHKFTVDPATKKVIINDGVTALDIKEDIYKALKEWYQLRGYSKYLFPIRTIGGDATPGDKFAGDIYFLINGYRISYDPTKVKITGVLYSDDFDTAWTYSANGEPVYPAEASNLVLAVQPSLEGLEIPTSIQNAAAVWDYSKASAEATVGSIGEYITSHLHDLHYISRAVWIDTELVAAGDGSQGTPFNTLTAAIDFAETENIKTLYVYSDIVIDRQLKNFTIIGVGTPTVDCNGQNLNKSEFSHVKLEGNYTGSIIAQESVLLNNFYLNGYFETCGLAGNLLTNNLAIVLLTQCISVIAGIDRPTISFPAVGSANISIRKNGGGITMRGSIDASNTCTVEVSEGSLAFDNTNILGDMVARGVCRFVDQTGVGVTVTDDTVARLIWEDQIEGTYTAEEVQRIVAAAAAGAASGLDTLTPVFMAITGSKPRIAATTDKDGNRSSVILDET